MLHHAIMSELQSGQSSTIRKWDRRFIELAFHVANWSKDPSTKCGAIIVAPDRRVVSVGYNGFPRKLKDTPELLNNREVKYSRTIHCEMNALLAATEPVEGCTLYTTPSLSCDRCVVHMIQAGITCFVGPWPFGDFGKRWGARVQETRDRIVEAGCNFREVDLETMLYRKAG